MTFCRCQSHEIFGLDKTMYTKIIGSAVVGGLMLAADHYSETMGLSTNGKAAHVVSAIGWASLSALIVDVAANAIRRKTEGNTTVYSDSAPEALADSSRYICNADYIAHQTYSLIKKALFRSSDNQQNDPENIPLTNLDNPPESPTGNSRSSIDSLMLHQTETEHQKEPFLSTKSAVSTGLVSGYAIINGARTFIHKNNPAAMLPILHSLTGYLPRVIGDALQKAGIDEALDLDKTMAIRIIGTAVGGALTLAASHYPEAMGLNADEKAVFIASAIGWASLSSLITDIATNAMRRKMDGTATVYNKSSPGNVADSSSFLCNADYIASHAYSLVQKSLAKTYAPISQSEV